jgi:hypothetical protein
LMRWESRITRMLMIQHLGNLMLILIEVLNDPS